MSGYTEVRVIQEDDTTCQTRIAYIPEKQYRPFRFRFMNGDRAISEWAYTVEEFKQLKEAIDQLIEDYD